MYNLKEISKRVRHLLGEPITIVELSDEVLDSLLKISINKWSMLSKLSNLDHIKLEQIETKWVESYFQATCKESLGRVRGKFKGKLQIPGGEHFLNYTDLLDESNKEKTLLEELLIPLSEKILVAVYLNVDNMTHEDVKKNMEKISEKIKVKGFQFLFIPIKNQDTKIECVYPNSNMSEETKNLINARLETILKTNHE